MSTTFETPGQVERDWSDAISPIEEIIEDARNGKMFVLVDHEDRENEGDLVIPAQMATPDAINFMAKHGRGLICLTLTSERIDALDLPLMASHNSSRHETAFTISIEAREGVTTGISAADRARTVSTAIDASKGAADIATPGHVFPLRARDGGVLVRAGHTEAAVDISRLAGLNPSGVICEIMKDDGDMARLPDLITFAKNHDLKIASIADLIAWRRQNESLVQRTMESVVTLKIGGEWRLVIYVNTISNVEHVVLIKGDISTDDPLLVRMHRVDLLTDLLGQVSEKRSGNELNAAMQSITDAGRGIIVLLRESSSLSLSPMISGASSGGEDGSDHVHGLREYGVGAQILVDLGIRRMTLLSNSPSNVISIEGYDLEIDGWQSLEG